MVVVYCPSCYQLRPWPRSRHQGQKYPSGLGVHCRAVVRSDRRTLREYAHIRYLPIERVA